jgi:hypothetical protein
MNGPIDQRTPLDFLRLIRNHPDLQYMYLNSPGGSVSSALIIADYVFEMKINTFIRSEEVCYSACAYIFFAGNFRNASAGKLGVHQVSSNGYSDESNLQIALADILSALNKYNVNMKVLEYMLATKPDDIYVFNEYELETLSLNISKEQKDKGAPKDNNAPDILLSYSAARISNKIVEITEKDFGKSLKVNGEILHENYLISLEEIITIDDRKVLLGSSHEGGNMCESQYFLLYVSREGSVKFDGPLDSCVRFEYTIDKSEIIFKEPEAPGKIGTTWIWKPDAGLTSKDDVHYKPDSNNGWDALQRNGIDHPATLFSYPEIESEISELLGESYNTYRDILTVGNGTLEDGYYFGQACMAHNCDVTGAIIIADFSKRTVFLAWKPEKEKIAVRPPVSDWPSVYRKRLASWAKQWN